MTNANYISCPLARTRKNQQPPWWILNLKKVRDKPRRFFVACKWTLKYNKWSEYNTDLETFKKRTTECCEILLARLLSHRKAYGSWIEDSAEIPLSQPQKDLKTNIYQKPL